MNLKTIFNSRLLKRTAAIYVLFGLIPTFFLVVLPSIYQFNLRSKTAEAAAYLSNQNSLDNLEQLVSARANEFGMILENGAVIASQLAERVEFALKNDLKNCDWNVLEETIPVSGGWRIAKSDQLVGLIVSPMIDPDNNFCTRQNSIFSIQDDFQILFDIHPTTRTIFLATEDQVLWLYPNIYWREDSFSEPNNVDLTQREYFYETRDLVWTKPYSDIEQVVTVAAPVWHQDEFWGMAGIDFSIEKLLSSVLNEKIGQNGFEMLIDDELNIIALPEEGASLISSRVDVFPLNQNINLQEILDKSDWNFLVDTGFKSYFNVAQDFSFMIELNNQDFVWAVSSLPEVNWYLVIVQPMVEINQLNVEMLSTLDDSFQNIFRVSTLAGAGYLIAVVMAGLFVNFQLTIPIRNLSIASKEFAGGNLEYRVPKRKWNDELSDLAESFNHMAVEITKSHQKFEDEQNRVQRLLTTKAWEFEVINQIVALINNSMTLPERLNRAVKIIRKYTGTDIISIALLDKNQELVLTAVACEPHLRKEVIRHSLQCKNIGIIHQAMTKMKDIRIIDIQEPGVCESLEQKQSYLNLNVRMITAKPIIFRKKLMGVMILMRHEVQEIEDNLRKFADQIVNMIALLIEHSIHEEDNRTLVIMEERQRLARELHDSVTQTLFTLRMATEGLRPQKSQKRALESYELLITQIEAVQKEMRNLINELRPVDMDGINLDEALENHISRLRRFSDIQANLSIQGNVKRIPMQVQRHLNRIAQEALSNISRHANASSASVELEIQDEKLVLLIKDNGEGINPMWVSMETKDSMGLDSMRARTEIIGGVFALDSHPDKGTKITVTIPLRNMEVPNE